MTALPDQFMKSLQESDAIHDAIRQPALDAFAAGQDAEEYLRIFLCGKPGHDGLDASWSVEAMAVVDLLCDLQSLQCRSNPQTLAGSSKPSQILATSAAGSGNKRDDFRFVPGDLHVGGSLEVQSKLVVGGDLTVDGLLEVYEWNNLFVRGNIRCQSLWATKSFVTISGLVDANDLVFLDDGVRFAVGDDIRAPLLVCGSLGVSELRVKGFLPNLRLDLMREEDEARLSAMFRDGAVSRKDDLFEWNLRNALREGRPIWQSRPAATLETPEQRDARIVAEMKAELMAFKGTQREQLAFLTAQWLDRLAALTTAQRGAAVATIRRTIKSKKVRADRDRMLKALED